MHPRLAKNVLFEATQALAYLHSQQICHGDLTLLNVLLPLSQMLNDFSAKELYESIGHPRLFYAHALCADLGEEGPHTPTYAVEPATYRLPMSKLVNFVGADARIIDFDQAFHFDDAPCEALGIAPPFLSPEATFEPKAGWHSDIWALGCVIFRARAGIDVFGSFDGTTTMTLRMMAASLGDFSDAWKAIKLDHEHGLLVKSGEDVTEASVLNYWDILTDSLSEKVKRIKDAPVDIDQMNGSHHGCNQISWITRKLEYAIIFLDKPDKERYDQQPNIPEEEALLLRDLLSKISVYNPLRRPSAEEILLHAWFDDVRYEFEAV